MVFEKVIVIDCRGHLIGRLASVIAKELLKGQKIVAVRCEDINISGRLQRNKLLYLSFLNKKNSVQPSHGPLHFRAPCKMLWRAVRGMLPHKTPRGAAALHRLTVFDGCPPPYDKVKKVVVPDAITNLRLKPMRKFTVLKDISTGVGWKHESTIDDLERKRKIKAKAWFTRQKALKSLKQKAIQELQ